MPRGRFSAASLFAAKPVAKGRLGPGTVVWARVPYEEADDWKTRPAVIMMVAGRRVTLLPGTTSTSRWRFPDKYVEVANPVECGLTRPTGFRRQAVTVDIIEVEDIVGCLDADASAALLGCPS
jgi:hypothetical protein